MSKVSLYIYRFQPQTELAADTWLDASELSNYAQMSSEKRRQEFLQARFFIKSVLREHYHIPHAVILKNPHGKPYVTGLCFNISHSENCLVLAVSPAAEVGVDVEISKDKKAYLEIAQQYFSALECHTILAAKSVRDQQNIFKNLWALKEAYVKAHDGIINEASVRVYFDLNRNKLESRLPDKTLSFFLSKSHHIAVCVREKIKLKDLEVWQVEAPSELPEQLLFQRLPGDF